MKKDMDPVLGEDSGTNANNVSNKGQKIKKDDPNINKLDTLPEKFTKEFVDYVTQMKKLITEERTRLEQLKESMYGVC